LRGNHGALQERSRMSKNSRAKGKRGELELAEFFREHGIQARRGQQFRGGPDSPDIIHDLPGIHVECKRTEAFRLYPALEQASAERRDATVPVVFHRANKRPWVVVLDASDFLTLIRAAEDAKTNSGADTRSKGTPS
jgi:Holliday junction resolvase